MLESSSPANAPACRPPLPPTSAWCRCSIGAFSHVVVTMSAVRQLAHSRACQLPGNLLTMLLFPAFNDFASARKKYRVSRHEIAVFNGRLVENPLNTGNPCQFRLPSGRKSLNTEYTCHETRYFLREGVETIEYRKFVPAKSCRQCQIVDYWNCAPAKVGCIGHQVGGAPGIRRPAGENPWRVSYQASGTFGMQCLVGEKSTACQLLGKWHAWHSASGRQKPAMCWLSGVRRAPTRRAARSNQAGSALRPGVQGAWHSTSGHRKPVAC